ncbi:TIGR03086 family metal-binding protein [Kribbia dieselivorans]|uniref:TIGR03086 family metal-binding protein n=1 Tax=Kribbia dieselivorans TaxID=331526 RepID=UPI00083878C1|nr:TIGR03086 family metal-binding protein [Kribbia dieselivorans]
MTYDAAVTYDRYNTPLMKVIDAVPADAWQAPSPCQGWNTGEVVQHLIDTQREFLLGHGVDLAQLPHDLDPATAWRTHAEMVSRALIEPGTGDREYQGAFGTTTIGATMASFYTFDLVAHRWDIARGAGHDTDFTEAELDFLEASADAWGDNLYTQGVCAPAIDVPADAPRQTRVLGRLGRDTNWSAGR